MADSTMKIGNSVKFLNRATEHGTPFFELLPREIRNQIFGHVYDDGEVSVKVVLKKAWNEHEKDRKRFDRDAYVPRSFPSSPLACMAVSKQYLSEAAEEWFRTKIIVFRCGQPAHDILEQDQNTVQHLQRVHYDWFLPHSLTQIGCFLKFCPRLRELRADVHSLLLDESSEKVSCGDEFGPEDFDQIEELQNIVWKPNLQKVVLKPGCNRFIHRDGDEERWQQNVAALQTYVMAKINASKNQSAAITEQYTDHHSVTSDDAESDLQSVAESKDDTELAISTGTQNIHTVDSGTQTEVLPDTSTIDDVIGMAALLVSLCYFGTQSDATRPKQVNASTQTDMLNPKRIRPCTRIRFVKSKKLHTSTQTDVLRRQRIGGSRQYREANARRIESNTKNERARTSTRPTPNSTSSIMHDVTNGLGIALMILAVSWLLYFTTVIM